MGGCRRGRAITVFPSAVLCSSWNRTGCRSCGEVCRNLISFHDAHVLCTDTLNLLLYLSFFFFPVEFWWYFPLSICLKKMKMDERRIYPQWRKPSGPFQTLNILQRKQDGSKYLSHTPSQKSILIANSNGQPLHPNTPWDGDMIWKLPGLSIGCFVRHINYFLSALS